MSALQEQGAGRFIGARVHRREDPRLLTGRGTYVDDVHLRGTLHAAFVRSPLAHARITSIDVAPALALPGVRVLTGADLNDDAAAPLWAFPDPFPVVTALAQDTVRYVGDPVAIVVAESRYAAEDAAELVDVRYAPLPAVTGREHAAVTEDEVHEGMGTNVAWSAASPEDPALDAAMAGSAHVLTETIRQQRHVAVPMEGRAILASWEQPSGELTVYAASQGPHRDRDTLARVLGVPEHQIRVIMRDVGGGFGQKIFRAREEIAVVLAARRIGAPVKWIEDRQENLSAGPSSRDEQLTVSIGVDADGVLQGIRADYLGDVGAYPQMPPLIPGMHALSVLPGPYKLDHYGWAGRSVFSHTPGDAAYRGPWLMETTGREIVLDLLAREIGMDPAELRRRNLLSADDLPYTNAMGAVYEQLTPAEAFEAALEHIDYEGFRDRQAAARAEGRYLGIGISTYIEPTAQPFGSGATEVATIRVQPSGKVNVLMGTGSHGHSLETTMVQVVADHLGVPIEDVRMEQGDTAVAPYGGGTAGSRSAVIAGNAARLGAVRVRDKVFALAGHLLEAAPEDLEIEQGVISVKGSPDATITFAQVASAAYNTPNELPEGMDAGLETTARYTTPSTTQANSTQVCTVEVDPETGQVTFLDYVVGGDCGIMINPMVVEGQIAGGVAQGIGGVLLEHLPYDEAGNPLAITFKDYLLPTSANVPDLRYVHLETPAPSPGGHKGVGEGGTIGAYAAVVNAVADALAPLGVHIAELPLSPDRLLALIDAAQA